MCLQGACDGGGLVAKSCMIKTEIRLTIFFAAKDGEAVHSQQKQDQELAVDLTLNSLLQNPGLPGRK